MTDDTAALVGRELADELGEALARIEHCLAQLTDEQAWWRPRADLNSVGNLVLHLTGNVRQLICSELGGAPTRARPAGRVRRPGAGPRGRPAGRPAGGGGGRRGGADGAGGGRLGAGLLVPGQPATAVGLAVRSVAHFRGHAQEVIHLTRAILGDAYRFVGPPPGGPPR